MQIFLDILGALILVIAAYNFYMALEYGNSAVFQTLDKQIHLCQWGLYSLLGVLLIIWK